MGRIALKAALTTGSVMVGDPTGSARHLAAAFGQELVNHALTEHAVKLEVGARAR
jgi:hypothetical protein